MKNKKVFVVIGAIILIIVGVIIYSVIVKDNKKTVDNSKPKEVETNIKSLVINYDTSTLLKDVFIINSLDGYKMNDIHSDYIYDYKSDNDDCTFILAKLKDYKSLKNIISNYRDYYNLKDSDIKEVTINNIKWNTFSFLERTKIVYYLMEKDNSIYQLSIRFNSEKENNSVVEKIVNSINLK